MDMHLAYRCQILRLVDTGIRRSKKVKEIGKLTKTIDSVPIKFKYKSIKVAL